MRFRSRHVLVAVLVALTAASPAAATFPGENGRIAFDRLAEQDEMFAVDIFSVEPDGSRLFQLTSFGFDYFAEFPDTSPDGRTIAFQRVDAAVEDIQIWLMDADGSDPRPLTAFTNGAFDPAYSPDGRTLAVDSFMDDSPGIFLVGVRTHRGRPLGDDKARRVTSVTDGGFDSEPQFSPDGRWIVFTRYSVECTSDETFEGCQTRIFRVRTNGRDLQQLTGAALNASAPDYHPSGRWIAFDTGDNAVAANAGHIMVMNTDGSGKRTIIRGDAEDFYNNPSFSPDGSKVAYGRWPVDDSEGSSIWTARADGSRQRQITHPPIWDNKPDWGSRPRHGHH